MENTNTTGTKKTLGWIGTGVMGKSMCKHLLNAGYDLMVYNRTESKTAELIEMGAKFADPKTIAQSCDTVFLMLGYPRDVEDMAFNSDYGLLNNMKQGSCLIDHTTSSPDLAEKIYAAAKEKGISSWDAPVSGGDVGAKNGQLVVMVGGPSEGFDPIKEIMMHYSKNVSLMGTAGKGQHTKMTNQIILAGNMIGCCEGLLYASKAGLDQNEIITLLGGGAASSFSLCNLGPRIIKGDFEPGFFVEHYVKDMEIALAECTKMGIKLRGLELVHSFYKILVEDGLEKKGTQGLYLGLLKLNNISN
jgi:3-hydroxyisobutyrate dehydrogenase